MILEVVVSGILVIVADDLSTSTLEGLPTPALDLLIQGGTRFPNSFGNTNCSPTRVELITGGYSWRWKIGTTIKPKWRDMEGRDNPSLPKGTPTLGTLARSAGYRSAFFGKWHVSNATAVPERLGPLEFDFDSWRAGSAFGVGDEGYDSWTQYSDGLVSRSTRYNTLAISQSFVMWKRMLGNQHKWVAFVAFNAPHAPYHVPPPGLLRGFEVGPDSDDRTKYHAAVVALDTCIGEMLATLSPSDTVFFLADNGTPDDVLPDGVQHGKGSMQRGGVALSLVAKGPRFGKGSRFGAVDERLVSATDLLPTCADLLGVDASAWGPDGSSLFGPPRAFVGSTYFVPNGGRLGEKAVERWSVVGGSPLLRLVRDDGALGLFVDATGEELDPEAHAEAFGVLRRELEAHRGLFGVLPGSGGDEPPDRDPDTEG